MDNTKTATIAIFCSVIAAGCGFYAGYIYSGRRCREWYERRDRDLMARGQLDFINRLPVQNTAKQSASQSSGSGNPFRDFRQTISTQNAATAIPDPPPSQNNISVLAASLPVIMPNRGMTFLDQRKS